MKLAVTTGTLPPDQFEDNDSASTAKKFYTGCNPDLNIEQPGEDDYYHLSVASTDALNVSIQFNPSGGALKLFLDGVEATQSLSLSSGEKILRISRPGTDGVSTFRVTGARNRYKLCASIDYCTVGSVYDCLGNCVSKPVALARIGNGNCDNGQYGMDLRCDQFQKDGGDCFKQGATPKGTCGPTSIFDCSGNCVMTQVLQAMEGDSWCDQGTRGADLACSAFKDDGGDCTPPSDDNHTCQKAIKLSYGQWFDGSINQAGEEDWYKLEIFGFNWLVVTTSGNTDTIGELFEQCGGTPITTDDNTKDGTNFQLYTLANGTYYIRVRHKKSSGTGKYKLETFVKPLL